MITVSDVMNWCKDHDVEYGKYGIERILETYMENKAGLLEKFRKHPNWDENAMAIVFKESQYNRGFNKNAVRDFRAWCQSEITNILSKNSDNLIGQNLESEIDKIERLINEYNSKLNYMFRRLNINPLVDGEPIILNLNDRLAPLKDKYNKYMYLYGYYVEKEQGEKFNNAIGALNVCKKAVSHIMTKELADEINAYVDVKAVEGQKLSRVIRKICASCGITDIKDIRPYRNISGEEVMRDYGFTRQFAMLCDEINPIEYKRITVISLNPLDYLSMSHGKKWTSCHHVGDGEDGCYSSGTISYMLDDVSVIYYIIDKDYEGNEYFSQPKEKRCVFCIEPDGDMILESRVYPDGRDGGDDTLASQFRTVMQKVVSDLWEKNNYWDLKKGYDNCKAYTNTYGTHYPDYTYYDDCNVSINKDLVENKKINIGHDPICINCGESHSDIENVVCECCRDDVVHCARCGDSIDVDDAIYCADNGNYYCDDSCAENDDVFYCTDDYEYHHIDYCFYDEYLGEYRSGEPEIEAEDGTKYESCDNAYANDYESDENGYWYPRNELVYCEDEGIFVHEDDSDLIHTEDDKYFSCESEANYYDYYEDINGDWYHEDKLQYCEDEDVYVLCDDAVYIKNDDIYFSSEIYAEEAGYHKNEDNEWVKESEVA